MSWNKFVRRVGAKHLILVFILIVGFVYIHESTKEVDNTQTFEVNGTNVTEVVYLPGDVVPRRSISWIEVFAGILLIGLITYDKFEQESNESRILTAPEVYETIEEFVELYQNKGLFPKKTKILLDAKIEYESFVNEETGEQTKTRPVKWISVVRCFTDEGTWDKDYKIGMTPTGDGFGIDEIVPIKDKKFDISKNPTIIKYIKSKENFESITGKKSSK